MRYRELIENNSFPEYDTEEDRMAAAKRLCQSVKRFADGKPINIELHPEIRYGTLQGILLTDLYVKEPGNGVGTIVMKKLLDLADDAGFNVMTNAEGPRSRDYYIEKLGFVDAPSHTGNQLIHYVPFDYDEWLNESASQLEISISGRGMYGDRCVAINLDSLDGLWEIATKLAHENMDVSSPSTDSMGLGMVAYWRSMKWPDDLPGNLDSDDHDY